MTGRAGFTIVEILLALLLLSFVVLGFQAATGQIIHYAAQSDRSLVASQLARDRLELIRMDTDYDGLEARYEATETQMAGFPGLKRQTVITHVMDTLATGILDYQRITVTITGGGLRAPISRSLVVAAP